MRIRVPLFISLVASCAFLVPAAPGAVIFQSKRSKLNIPGEEEVSGNAQQLFNIAQAAENAGNLTRAIKAYRKVVLTHPRDTLAPEAGFQTAALEERIGDALRSAADYRFVVEHFPQSPRFNEALEGQFRIGESYLNGRKKRKLLGVAFGNSLNEAVEIFAAIVRTAPYGRYTARAQFDIGRAREKQNQNDAAVAAYQAVVDKFPNDPLAADAQYQIGYLWYVAARAGTADTAAVTKAKTGFQDFLFRYPKNEKAAQAHQNLNALEHKQTTDSYRIAQFYDKQRNYRAAAIYYNDVVRQQPGSPEGDRAKNRVEAIRAKLGDAALKAALAPPPARKNNRTAAAGPGNGRSGGGGPAMRGVNPSDIAPLPPPETDLSLPPPASLMPDSTSAPEPSPAPPPAASPEEAAGPEPTPAP